jgi:hypothetical protein
MPGPPNGAGRIGNVPPAIHLYSVQINHVFSDKSLLPIGQFCLVWGMACAIPACRAFIRIDLDKA